jgi:hypothetical protein
VHTAQQQMDAGAAADASAANGLGVPAPASPPSLSQPILLPTLTASEMARVILCYGVLGIPPGGMDKTAPDAVPELGTHEQSPVQGESGSGSSDGSYGSSSDSSSGQAPAQSSTAPLPLSSAASQPVDRSSSSSAAAFPPLVQAPTLGAAQSPPAQPPPTAPTLSWSSQQQAAMEAALAAQATHRRMWEGGQLVGASTADALLGDGVLLPPLPPQVVVGN